MTAQFPDIIIYNGERRALLCNPLESYFDANPPRPELPPLSTGCWRGYVATWLIDSDRLYLTAVRTDGSQGGEVSDGGETLGGPIMFVQLARAQKSLALADFFPGASGPVFASWFTGELRLPDGEMLHYEHAGYEQVFEQDIRIDIRDGQVLTVRTVAPPAEWVAEARERIRQDQISREQEFADDDRCDRIRAHLISHVPHRWPGQGMLSLEIIVNGTGSGSAAEFFEDLFEFNDDLDALISPTASLEGLTERVVNGLIMDSSPERRNRYLKQFMQQFITYDCEDEELSEPDIDEAVAAATNEVRGFLLECRRVAQSAPSN